MRAGPRVVPATAATTLDYVSAAARGPTWREDTVAVANVTRPESDPGVVRFELELDGTDLEAVPGHAQHLELAPDQARTLAASLADAADAAEAEVTDG